jgi:hypothetical protein
MGKIVTRLRMLFYKNYLTFHFLLAIRELILLLKGRMRMLRLWITMCCFLPVLNGFGQRHYKVTSVLATGNWFKITTKDPGIYKVDLAFLNQLGVNTSNLSSAAIRLYGNGAQMLPENCSAAVVDDLQENAIQVNDGGDGIFNGSDYFLFYARGVDNWLKDSANHRFKHQKNLYTDQSVYYITIGGTGKRIATSTNNPAASVKISSYNDRYFHELDTINFLNSGKNWYGEEFTSAPGKSLTHTFIVPEGNYLSEPGTIISNAIARSVNQDSRLLLNINNSQVLTHTIPATSAGNQDKYAIESELAGTFTPAAALSISYSYQSSAEGAEAWLNWFELFLRKTLTMSGKNQLFFRDWNSVAAGNTGEFNLQTPGSATVVWDITDPAAAVQMKTVTEGNVLKFTNDCSTLHEYVSFINTGLLAPLAAGKLDNQNLHAAPAADLLVVSYPAILQQAQRLADYHRQHDNMKVVLVTAGQVYNEFSSGAPDPTAIRDFVKMYYDKAGADTASRPKYLLLFGDASFDYKNQSVTNTNFVPAYESLNALDPLASFTSDDYFGFLDDNDDINNGNSNLLDIGIGRIPAKNADEAKSFVDKLVNYNSPASLGPWRNQLSFIADDEDYNLHFDDAEVITATAAAVNPVFMQHKVYLDAYQQESNSSGSRYPAVNQIINNQIQNGTLVWNYNGHGGFTRLAEEVIVDKDIVNSWSNTNKLPLFITATCDFAPYDNFTINSLGENILLRPNTGAIALMTTTRLVFAFSNRIMNRNYIQTLLQQNKNGSYPSLGTAIKTAKNITYQSGGDIINNLKFTLLGDPALAISFPKYQVTTTAINGELISTIPDTLKALKQYTINGAVTNGSGNILSDFNGSVYTTVYDKVQTATTLANDPESIKAHFEVQENIVFKGKTEVKNGHFSFTFIVPKDIDYKFGNGKISYYAENGQLDANGAFTNFIIGGSQGVSPDTQGPVINAFLNNETFLNGGVTGPAPLLLLKLYDTSGINILGTGIGHDITVTVDNDQSKLYKLNDFFEPVLNNYQSGTIQFQLPALAAGIHSLKIKVWDGVNNSSETTLTCMVQTNLSFSIFRLVNFPNPFNTKTTFRFDHNLNAQNIDVSIYIYTSSGRLIKSIKRAINTGGNRSSDVEWDGNSDLGPRVKTGVYFYILSVTSENGSLVKKAGKLVVL